MLPAISYKPHENDYVAVQQWTFGKLPNDATPASSCELTTACTAV